MTAAEEAADRLESLQAVQNHAKALRLAVRQEQVYRSGLLDIFQKLTPPNPPLSAAQLRKDLDVSRLQRVAAGQGVEALSAQRHLELVAVHMSFYLPRQMMREGQYARVVPVLELATELRPQRADLWYNLACAQAVGGSKTRAVTALERAVEAGFTNLAHIEADPDLESLRKLKAYKRILDGLHAKSEPTAKP